MKSVAFAAVAVAVLFSISGCQTARPGSPEAKAIAIQKVEERKIETVSESVENIPSWCNLPPSSDNALYACGTGKSTSMSIARKRAGLRAKASLLDSIGSQLSQRAEDFQQSTGSTDNAEVLERFSLIIKNVTNERTLNGYKAIEADTQAVGKEYRHYVLLEYPIGKANQALLNEIKQDEILKTQKAADEAMAELEAEINKKKAQ